MSSPAILRPNYIIANLTGLFAPGEYVLRRGWGYKDLRYLLLKAQRMAATKTEYATFRKAA